MSNYPWVGDPKSWLEHSAGQWAGLLNGFAAQAQHVTTDMEDTAIEALFKVAEAVGELWAVFDEGEDE